MKNERPLTTADKIRCVFYLKKHGVDLKYWSYSDLENIFQAMHSYALKEYRNGKKNDTSFDQLELFNHTPK